jgi:hypothetical protein
MKIKKNGNIINLTESDLNRISKGVLNEDVSSVDLEKRVTQLEKKVNTIIKSFPNKKMNEEIENEYDGDYTPTLKEKIEGVIRNSVTNSEEVIQVLEDILNDRKSGRDMRNRLRKG